MANVLLGATGSVAAVRVPALYDALTTAGHDVKVVATALRPTSSTRRKSDGSDPPPAPLPAGRRKSVLAPPPLQGGLGWVLL